MPRPQTTGCAVIVAGEGAHGGYARKSPGCISGGDVKCENPPGGLGLFYGAHRNDQLNHGVHALRGTPVRLGQKLKAWDEG